MAISRRSKRWLIFLSIVALLVLGLKLGKDDMAAKALRSVAQVAEKGGHRITFEGVSVSLIGKHIRITGLAVVPLADSTLEDSAVRYTVHAEAIDLQGVDVWALIRKRVLHVGHIELHGPSVSHSFVTRTGAKVKKESPTGTGGSGSAALELLHVDTLLIADATGRSQDRGQANPAVTVADLDLLLTDINVNDDGTGAPVLRMGSVRMGLHQAEAHLKPYYTLALDSMRISVPEDTAVVFGLHFTPDVSPKEYHKQVEFQVELYQAAVDTIMITGFDLAAKLEGGAIRAHTIYVAGVAVDIHRDKSIPLSKEVKFKPLAADLVASWPMPISVDTIAISRGSVTYNERLKRNADYGSIAFTDITGRLTGLTNEPVTDARDLRLQGTARLGGALAELDLRMPMQSDHTTVTMDVSLRNLPAKEMNRMTDDLLHVNATGGTIHLGKMHMVGDETSASGTMDLRYEGLQIKISPVVDHAKVITALANTVVRGANMPGEKGYRLGHFTVKRHTDSGLFNYLWIGLREGMMDVVLPPVLLKQLRKGKK